MPNSINERLITFSGKACIQEDLEIGNDVSFKIKGGVISKEERDNQDGTHDLIFKCKIITAEPCEE